MSTMSPAEDRPIARTATMIRILGISERHLGRLAKRGDLPEPVARGRWDVIPTVQAYVAYQERKATEEASKRSGAEDPALVQARRRKVEAEAERVVIELAVRRGDLVPVDRVTRTAFEAARQARDALLNIAPRLAGVFAGEADERRCRELLTVEIEGALGHLPEPGEPPDDGSRDGGRADR